MTRMAVSHPASPIAEKQSFGRRLPWGAIAALLLTLPALWLLARPGFFVSHDGRFHVYRIAALANAWQDGVLYPRLFPEFGFGYGQAVLNFYSPLSYYPGALFTTLGLSPAAAAEITLALSFLLAALAAYGYGRYLLKDAGPGLAQAAGVLAAVVYTYTPYHLADAYVRGAIPEHVAFIFPPLILWAYTAAFRKNDPLRGARSGPWPPMLWGTLAWVGLVLTHNLTALILAPVVAVQLLVLAGWTRRWRRLLGAIGTLALAIGISAAYWLPVLLESRAVGLALGPSRGYAEHWLNAATLLRRAAAYFVNPPDTLGRIYPLSWFALVLTVLVAVLLFLRWRQRQLPAAWPPILFHLGCYIVCHADDHRGLGAGLGSSEAYPWQSAVSLAFFGAGGAGSARAGSRPARTAAGRPPCHPDRDCCTARHARQPARPDTGASVAARCLKPFDRADVARGRRSRPGRRHLDRRVPAVDSHGAALGAGPVARWGS